jgi:hypothetical protein
MIAEAVTARRSWRVAGATVRVEGFDRDRVAALERRLEPEPVDTDDRAVHDMTLTGNATQPELVDIQNPARDDTTTAWDGRRGWLLSPRGWCAIPEAWAQPPIEIDCSSGFPIDTLLRRIVLPALQLSAPSRGSVIVHGSACAFDDRAIVIAGWSESGKTETALALCERGAGFVSDKWTCIGSDGRAGAFPASVGIRRWVLPHLPRLRAALPSIATAQLRSAAIADALLAPVRRTARGRARSVLDRVEAVRALGDRAALRRRSLTEIYPGQGPTPKVGVLAILHVWQQDRVVVSEADRAEICRELARTAAYERREFFSLHDRLDFARTDRELDVRASSIEADERTLYDALADVQVVRVSTPFPVDPRRVAAELPLP